MVCEREGEGERAGEREREREGRKEAKSSLKIKNENTGNIMMWLETWPGARSPGSQSVFWY